jgi:hypothetical protein
MALDRKEPVVASMLHQASAVLTRRCRKLVSDHVSTRLAARYAKVKEALDVREAKTFIVGDGHDGRNVLALSPDHDRLTLCLLEDFIQARLGFCLTS